MDVWLNGQKLATGFDMSLSPQPIGFTGYTVGALRRNTVSGEIAMATRIDWSAAFPINDATADAIWQAVKNS